MTVAFLKNLCGSRMRLHPPATKESMQEIEQRLGIKLPDQYIDFMLETNGCEGMVGDHDNSFLMIWPAEKIIQLNDGHLANRFNLGLIYFGSDGGGMAYAFDIRDYTTPIVEIPFESIHADDARFCGRTFTEFLQYLAKRT
jgi:hypothetical protein